MENIYQKALELSFKKLNSPVPSYKRFVFNKIDSSISKIIGIYGSRGVGKTTLILQYLNKLKTDKKLYISLDHPIFENISLFEFVEYANNYGIETIGIDEIHFYKNFEQELKNIYDFLDIKVIFSGSSAVKLTNASFARRYAMFHLPILSFREYLELKFNIKLPSFSLNEIFNTNASYEILSSIDFKILPEFKNFLKEGAYPFYFQDPQSYYDKIIRTINTILYEDLSFLDIDYKKIDSLKKLLLNICFSKPLEVNIEKLASSVSITKVSLYKYLEILDRAELINRVIHSQKRFSNIKKPDKLYLSNTNLLYALCNPEIGQVRETFFVSNVKTINDIYFAEKGDFLIPLNNKETVVEIGGKSKTFKQIKDIENSYLILDDIEIGSSRIIPLWLFGFLY
ncbi:ATP-binding protein [Caminibacter sp.]